MSSPRSGPSSVRITAPGKLMVAGEYVVLDGAEALVASVDARLLCVGAYSTPDSSASGDGSRASADRSGDAPSLPPEALLTRQRAEEALGPALGMTLTIDASSLRSEASAAGDTRKLGLGSSSAASGAVLAWHGIDPASRRRDALAWALAGHRAIAPQGSGADVAAATLGGVVRFLRAEAEAAQPIEWPEGLAVDVVWSGHEARTSGMVKRVRALEDADPAAYRAVATPLRDAAGALIAALAEGRCADAVAAADRHGDAMARLGEAADVPIVTPELARIAALARAHGGGAKPSGAGGGDVALAFFADPSGRAAFRAACLEAGLTPLSTRIGDEGVRLEPSAP